MIIKSLALKNYRNYSDLFLEFDKKTNVFFGNNAQGKTNILEAIYLCSTLKSPRTNKEKELIKFTKQESHIRLILEKNNIDYKIDIHLKNNKKKGVAINGVPITQLRDLLSLSNIIIFSPEDLGIIKFEPKQRRKFIDIELCKIDPIYYYNLQQYYKVLKQRNNLLKQLNYDKTKEDLLDIWDEQLVGYGKAIIQKRENFINKLNNILVDIHTRLTGGKEKLVLIYNKNITIDNYNQFIKNNKIKDIKSKTTLTGPHRDDITFNVNNIDIRKFGSQGQQRTAALSLKLAQLELVKLNIDDSPILLLDDVLSELDSNRQNFLLSSITSIQTLITCTGIDDFISNNLLINKLYEVKNANVNQIFDKI